MAGKPRQSEAVTAQTALARVLQDLTSRVARLEQGWNETQRRVALLEEQNGDLLREVQSMKVRLQTRETT